MMNFIGCTAALLNEPQPLLPDMVLPELAFMILRELDYPVLSLFLQSIVQGELVIEQTTATDLERSIEILQKYADSRIDFVDCVIAAIAERLNIETILTVDRRHFQLFRPQHCSHFVLLPE